MDFVCSSFPIVHAIQDDGCRSLTDSRNRYSIMYDHILNRKLVFLLRHSTTENCTNFMKYIERCDVVVSVAENAGTMILPRFAYFC